MATNANNEVVGAAHEEEAEGQQLHPPFLLEPHQQKLLLQLQQEADRSGFDNYEDDDMTAFGRKNLLGVEIPPDFVVPDGFLRISNRAFYGQAITSITFPTSVTSIGHSAFYSIFLESIAFGSGLTSIERWAFAQELRDSQFTSLTHVDIPKGVTLGQDAFCASGLVSVSVPVSLANIPDQAFGYCTSLVDINVSANTTIHPDAFIFCDALQALASDCNMHINTYVQRVSILRAAACSAFYHFLLCERAASLLNGNADVLLHVAGFLFVVPPPPPVHDQV